MKSSGALSIVIHHNYDICNIWYHSICEVLLEINRVFPGSTSTMTEIVDYVCINLLPAPTLEALSTATNSIWQIRMFILAHPKYPSAVVKHNQLKTKHSRESIRCNRKCLVITWLLQQATINGCTSSLDPGLWNPSIRNQKITFINHTRIVSPSEWMVEFYIVWTANSLTEVEKTS